ncbi:MAG: hypothetical protein SHS37scaffold145_5 [Phage 71_18]|nr:MAG: hypothetical protein SHS37scaffold145_5 [Phage 71_18]
MAKTFKTKRRNEQPKEFTLEYQELVTEELPADAPEAAVPRTFLEDRSANFTAVPVAPGGALLDFTEKVEPSTGARPAAAIIQFMRDVLIDADVPRFEELIHSKSAQVDVEVLGDITNWLMEEYAGRPTLPSSASSNGGTPTGDGATVAPLSPA